MLTLKEKKLAVKGVLGDILMKDAENPMWGKIVKGKRIY